MTEPTPEQEEGPISDAVELAATIRDAGGDLLRLFRLETKLIARSILIIVVLALFLVLSLVITLSLFVATIAATIYHYTLLDLPGSLLWATGGALAVVAATVLGLRRCMRNLSYRETRQAVSMLWKNEATGEPPEEPCETSR